MQGTVTAPAPLAGPHPAPPRQPAGVPVASLRRAGGRLALDIDGPGGSGVTVLPAPAPAGTFAAAALRFLARNWDSLDSGVRSRGLAACTDPALPACPRECGGGCGTGLACLWASYREDLTHLDGLSCERWAESYDLDQLMDIFGVGDWDDAGAIAERWVKDGEARLLGTRAAGEAA